MRLTALAHERLGEILRPGDFAADATAGKGRDTLFLAKAVGEAGRVWAFDIQQVALDATLALLRENGVADRCEAALACHSTLEDRLPFEVRGRLSAVVANLGYLPGGDERIITDARASVAMIASAVKNLRPGGVLFIIVYPGHPGGEIESESVAAKCRTLADEGFFWEKHGGHDPVLRRPWLSILTKPGAVV